MKRLFALAIAALSAAVSAATLAPVQLLNPAGSTSGQAIVSTGPSSAPGWATVTVGNLAQVAANTVLANATGSTAAPSALAVPSCSASGNNLQYTSGTGFTCATGYAQLASPTFTGTVTTAALTATGAFTPSQTAGIVGTTTNNNANAGSVGEYPTPTNLSSVALTSATPINLANVSLTAGDWDVSCSVQFVPNAGTTVTQYIAGTSTTSATFSSFDRNTQLAASFVTGAPNSIAAPVTRILLSSTTTVYCVGQSTFATSTMTANGFIRARRVR